MITGKEELSFLLLFHFVFLLLFYFVDFVFVKKRKRCYLRGKVKKKGKGFQKGVSSNHFF